MIRAILAALLLSGCATATLDGSEWRETDDGRPALCTKDGDCYRPSEATWNYFVEAEIARRRLVK